MINALNLLMVEASEKEARRIVNHLQTGHWELRWSRVDSKQAMTEALMHGAWDIILINPYLPSFDRLETVDFLNGNGCDTPVVLLIDETDEARFLQEMPQSVKDCVSQNRLSRLIPVIEREVRHARQLRKAKTAVETEKQRNTRLLSFITHEIKNPLNAVTSFSEMLEKGMVGPLNEKQHKYVNCIRQGGDHLKAFINQIMDISRIEAGHVRDCLKR